MKPGLKKEATSLAVFLLSFLAIFITCFALVKSDANMNDKQGLPDLADCSLDFNGCEFGETYVKQHMKGEYEFFYNKWIVEENYTGEPDCRVNVPHHYKNTVLNGERLSNEGYSSYRMYIKGLPVGTKIWFINNNFVGGFYAYINSELVVKYGTRAKTGTCLSNGGDDMTLEYIVKDSNPLTVVFEVSSSYQGGLTSPARLAINTLGRNPTSQYLTNNIGFVMMGLILGLLAFSFVINLGAAKRDFSFSLVMGVITLMSFFSIDVYWRVLSIFRTNTYNSIIFLDLLIATVLPFALYYHLAKNQKIKHNWAYPIAFGAISTLSVIFYFVLMGTFYQVIPLIFSLLSLALLLIPLTKGMFEGARINLAFIFMVFSLLTYYAITFFDLENIMIAGTEQSISYVMLPIIVIIIVLYRLSTATKTKRYIKALEKEQKALQMKAEALTEQIKPHYVFNCLSSIQGAYQEDSKKGERMLTMFSKHLRDSLDVSSNLVPFEKEVERILRYAELENMRKEKKVDLLLNLESTDFSLPPLSLEPFIENAFKHGELEKINDGYVSVSSFEEEKGYLILIEDNGVGFDVNQVKPSSVGIKNAKERLKILCEAEVQITSRPNKGTTVEIRIPKESEDERDRV